MELLHLKYFLTVAKNQHITKAAKELRISQPSLSKIITSLEKEINRPLFDRKGRNITLNEDGKFFYNKVSKSLSILEDSIAELKDKNQDSPKEITLYVLSASSLMTELIVNFRHKYPDINFKLIQSLYDDKYLNNSDYDFCIYSSGGPDIGDSCVTLLDEEILLAVPTSNSLSNKTSIKIKDVKNESFICLGGGNYKYLTESFCKEYKFCPNIVFESNNTHTVRGLIASGQGISFIPKLTWRFDNYENIKLISLDESKYRRSVKLHQSPYCKDEEYISIFRNFIVEYFHNLEQNF